jgi:hypothetical protein
MSGTLPGFVYGAFNQVVHSCLLLLGGTIPAETKDARQTMPWCATMFVTKI